MHPLSVPSALPNYYHALPPPQYRLKPQPTPSGSPPRQDPHPLCRFVSTALLYRFIVSFLTPLYYIAPTSDGLSATILLISALQRFEYIL